MTKENQENDDIYTLYLGKPLKEMAEILSQYMNDKDELEARLKEINKRLTYIRNHVIPDLFEDQNLSSAKVDGVGSISVRGDLYVMLKDKDAGMDWFRDNDHGDLVYSTINPSTLRAFVKEQVREGNELPADIFDIRPFSRATLTREK